MTTSIRRDTKSWKTQVWISFGVAVTVCATGLGWLPGRRLERSRQYALRRLYPRWIRLARHALDRFFGQPAIPPLHPFAPAHGQAVQWLGPPVRREQYLDHRSVIEI